MKRFSRLLFWFVLVVLFAHTVVAATNDPNRAFVEQVLRNDKRRDWSKSPWEEHKEELKPMGKAALPILATFLPDCELGWQASEQSTTHWRSWPLAGLASPVR